MNLNNPQDLSQGIQWPNQTTWCQFLSLHLVFGLKDSSLFPVSNFSLFPIRNKEKERKKHCCHTVTLTLTTITTTITIYVSICLLLMQTLEISIQQVSSLLISYSSSCSKSFIQNINIIVFYPISVCVTRYKIHLGRDSYNFYFRLGSQWCVIDKLVEWEEVLFKILWKVSVLLLCTFSFVILFVIYICRTLKHSQQISHWCY